MICLVYKLVSSRGKVVMSGMVVMARKRGVPAHASGIGLSSAGGRKKKAASISLWICFSFICVAGKQSHS